MGRPRGGLTGKLHALADAEGHAVRLRLTGGLVHDACDAEVLIADIPHGATPLGGKGYDSTAIRAAADARRIWAIFPTGPAARTLSAFPPALPSRYPAECFFNRITQFRGIATRYDRELANYLAAVKLISARYGTPHYESAP